MQLILKRSPPGLDEQLNDYHHFGPSRLEFSEGLLGVSVGYSRALCLKPNGSVAYKISAEYFDPYSNGLAQIVTGNIYKWDRSFIDKTGKSAFPEKFNYVDNFSEGYSIASDPVNEKVKRIIDIQDKTVGIVETPLLMQFHEGLSRIGYATQFGRQTYKREFDFNEGCVPLNTLKFTRYDGLTR